MHAAAASLVAVRPQVVEVHREKAAQVVVGHRLPHGGVATTARWLHRRHRHGWRWRGGAAGPRGHECLRVGADPEEPLPCHRDARLGARCCHEGGAAGGASGGVGGVQGRVGRVRDVERARALRESLSGPARVEERGGERGGDPGAPRGELGSAAERRDRVARARLDRGTRVAEDVVRQRRRRVALREAGRRRRGGAAVVVMGVGPGLGADRGLGLLPEGGGGVLPVRVGRRRRRRTPRRGAGRLPGPAALLALAAHRSVSVVWGARAMPAAAQRSPRVAAAAQQRSSGAESRLVEGTAGVGPTRQRYMTFGQVMVLWRKSRTHRM